MTFTPLSKTAEALRRARWLALHLATDGVRDAVIACVSVLRLFSGFPRGRVRDVARGAVGGSSCQAFPLVPRPRHYEQPISGNPRKRTARPGLPLVASMGLGQHPWTGVNWCRVPKERRLFGSVALYQKLIMRKAFFGGWWIEGQNGQPRTGSVRLIQRR